MFIYLSVLILLMDLPPGIAEIIGNLIGDGYINRKNSKYQVGFVGSPITDRELFENLQRLLSEGFGKEAKIVLRERGLRMVFNSKEICSFLIDELGMAHGKVKCERVEIPFEILRDWDLAKHTLRGIMDTDGTVFVSKKPGIEKYSTMEITTTSPKLAKQIRGLLATQGFRVGNIRKSLSKLSKRPAHRVPLYGKKNLEK